MGNFHCISSSCAKVIYQGYLPPVIRWRYPGEDWQEIIEADNYTINSLKGKCPTLYHIFGTYVSKNSKCNQILYFKNSIAATGGGLSDFTPYIFNNTWNIKNASENNIFLREINSTFYKNKTLVTGGVPINYRAENLSCINTSSASYGYGLQVTDIIREDGQPDNCGDCIFTVTKNGQIVHEETRDVCPEVEQLPCRLSDVRQEIKIDKLPYINRIEVVPYGYGLSKLQVVPVPVPGRFEIPQNCLNIYVNDIYVPVPPQLQKASDKLPNFDILKQICSAPGCPPPEYEVICNCDETKDCPPGTCAIQCGSYICCYNDQGLAVETISIADYFPNNTREAGS